MGVKKRPSKVRNWCNVGSSGETSDGIFAKEKFTGEQAQAARKGNGYKKVTNGI